MRTITTLAALAATTVLACAAVAAESPPAPSANPVKHPSLKVCNKQADARSLTGPARAQFVRDCRDGKNTGKDAKKSS
jgi:Spy/CpxP family protein refolding chaperone